MKFPSLKFGGKKKGKQEDTEEKSSGNKPSKSGKKLKIKGFGFVLMVLIIAAVGMGGVAYAYLHFTGGLESIILKAQGSPTGDDTLDTLLDMYELQNVQAGKIEELQVENTGLVEKTVQLEKKTVELETTVEVYKTEINKIDPIKAAELEEITKPKPPPEENPSAEDGTQAPPVPKSFDEPEGGWETNEKIAAKLSDGTVASVESWNEKYGGWICKGDDEKLYLIIPSGTAIEANKLGL